MKKPNRPRRLEFDDTPPNAAQKKVERDLRAMRAVPAGVKLLVQSEVNGAVQRAMRELRSEKSGSVSEIAKTSTIHSRKTRNAS